LLEYTADAALAAKGLSHVILSTDDQEIAKVGERCGLHVPFVRPAELARDDTPTLPVVQHAIRSLEARGERFDAVCLLQPTSPLRRAADIDLCIELLDSSDADSVVTILPVPLEYNPHWVYFRGDGGRLRLSTGEAEPIARRQSLPPAFHREGSVYVTRTDVVMSDNSLFGKRIVGHPIDPRRSVNIDNAEDWSRAERLLATVSL
jgi:CMP-N-acetylneuraminic acid synthetase